GDLVVLVLALVLIFATISAMVYNRIFAAGPVDPYSALAEVWALVNVIVLALVALIAIESPRPRKEERFPSDHVAAYRIAAGEYRCRIRDISVSGALLEVVADGERQVHTGTNSAARPAPGNPTTPVAGAALRIPSSKKTGQELSRPAWAASGSSLELILE